jgi:hypothetical protein
LLDLFLTAWCLLLDLLAQIVHGDFKLAQDRADDVAFGQRKREVFGVDTRRPRSAACRAAI